MYEDIAVIGIGCNFPGGKRDIFQPYVVSTWCPSFCLVEHDFQSIPTYRSCMNLIV